MCAHYDDDRWMYKRLVSIATASHTTQHVTPCIGRQCRAAGLEHTLGVAVPMYATTAMVDGKRAHMHFQILGTPAQVLAANGGIGGSHRRRARPRHGGTGGKRRCRRGGARPCMAIGNEHGAKARGTTPPVRLGRRRPASSWIAPCMLHEAIRVVSLRAATAFTVAAYSPSP